MKIISIKNKRLGVTYDTEKEIKHCITANSGHDYFDHKKVIAVVVVDDHIEMKDAMDHYAELPGIYETKFQT